MNIEHNESYKHFFSKGWVLACHRWSGGTHYTLSKCNGDPDEVLTAHSGEELFEEWCELLTDCAIHHCMLNELKQLVRSKDSSVQDDLRAFIDNGTDDFEDYWEELERIGEAVCRYGLDIHYEMVGNGDISLKYSDKYGGYGYDDDWLLLRQELGEYMVNLEKEKLSRSLPISKTVNVDVRSARL